MVTVSAITMRCLTIQTQLNHVSIRSILMATVSTPTLRIQQAAILRSLGFPTVQPISGSRTISRSIRTMEVWMIERNTSTVQIPKTIHLTISCPTISITTGFQMQSRMPPVQIGAIPIPMVEGCSMVRNVLNSSGSSTA